MKPETAFGESGPVAAVIDSDDLDVIAEEWLCAVQGDGALVARDARNHPAA
jgi:hypothetical protein